MGLNTLFKNHYILFCRILLFIIIQGVFGKVIAADPDASLEKRRAFLSQIERMMPPDPGDAGVVTPLDSSWRAWLARTGELPPDFDAMPSIPFLPDPLLLDEGGRSIPVTDLNKWQEKRAWIQEQIKYWISGNFPPSPEHYDIQILHEEMDGRVLLRMVELRFGPGNKAKLTIEMMIPPGEGPFPVFMTQWNHRGWALLAVRRGYIGCVYAGADAKDDTQAYAELWYPEFDFTMLMRRAWGSFRALDYLHTLEIVDTNRIALSGHSRNGKQSLMAAAFDERIKAVISSSAGTGGELPYRFTNDKYDCESIWRMTALFPQWIHPRMRFFIGREHKLPIDQNLMMALVAPRGLMLSSAISEGAGNPLGIELGYRSALKVYRLYDADRNMAIRLRHGRHGTAARDIEAYLDFFDYVFGRSDRAPANYLYYNYSFDQWSELSREYIDPESFPAVKPGDFLNRNQETTLLTAEDRKVRKERIREQIQWMLGEEPPGVTNPGPKLLSNQRPLDDYLRDVILRPGKSDKIGHAVIGPYHSFGDYLYGNLYYPVDSLGRPPSGRIPVVIFLHEYDYTTGFAYRILPFFEDIVARGFAVFSYDMLGFGTRIEEGTDFYYRYPKWSKMGKMVTDLRGAVDALENMELIDPGKIYTVGYALGGTVGLLAAAGEERIRGLATVCGFTPLRSGTPDKGVEGIAAYSHLHGLIPRLGFFLEQPERLPLDFAEILAAISPRPHLIIAPQLDRDAVHHEVAETVGAVRQIYELSGAEDDLDFWDPLDYNHFTPAMQARIIQWLTERHRSP